MKAYRWRICALLFFATTINYIDRQIISILAPHLQDIFHWTEQDYSFIIMAFQIAYALGLLVAGRFLDRFGVRIGYAIAVFVWSLAASAHALASSVMGFVFARFGLALGEAGNFPAAIKTVTEWFPVKERAFATGLFNSGSTVGAIIAPLLIPFLVVTFGWQSTFIITGLLGIIWLFFWIPVYKSPEKTHNLTKREFDYIRSDNESTDSISIPWLKLLTYRQTIGICLCRFLTDAVWWFFLYWLPKYLYTQHGLNIQQLGLPLIIIYTCSSVGGIGGGWLSSFFLKIGKSVDHARKTTVLIMALMVVPVFFLSYLSNLWMAVLLISMATAAHQGWASNIFTIVSDIYPKNAVGSVSGLAGFAGASGGILFAPLVGFILETTGSYYIVFAYASLSYLLVWLILKIFIPQIYPIHLK